MDRFNFFQSRSPYGYDREDERVGQTERDRMRDGEREHNGSSYAGGGRSNSGADAGGGGQRQDHRQLLHAQSQHQQQQQQNHLQMQFDSQSQDRSRVPSRPASPYKSASFWDSLNLDQRLDRQSTGSGHGLGLGHAHDAERDGNAGHRGYSYSSTERDRPSSRGAVSAGGASRDARLETLGGGLRDMLAGHSTSFSSSYRAADHSRAHDSQSRPKSSLPPLSAPLHRAPSIATSKASPHGSYAGDIPSPLARSPAKRSAADTEKGRDQDAEEENKEHVNDNEKDGEDGDKGSQRSRNGCLVCRKRKVKCDETRPRCGKCAIKSRQCVWPEPGTTGNKKRRPSSTLDRPSAARPSAPSRSASQALSPKEEIFEQSAGPSGAASIFLDGTTNPALDSRSRSQSQSQSHFEPNPLASLVGAAHASAIQDQRQSFSSGPRSNANSTISQGLTGLQDLPKLQPRSSISSGPHAGNGIGYGDSMSGPTGADPSPSSLSTRVDTIDATDAHKNKKPRTGRGNKKAGEVERHRNASPGADLRPTGRASLAQILDTHESLNAARANGFAASGYGTKRSGIDSNDDGRSASGINGYGPGQGLEHAIYQHQRQQGSLSQSRLSSSHPPPNAQTYPTIDPQKANSASATGTGSGPMSAPANTSATGPPFSVQKGYDLGAMLDDARRGVEGRQGPSNGDIRGQPMTVEPINLHRPSQVDSQRPGHGQYQDPSLPKFDTNLDLQRYTQTNGATSGNAQAEEFGHIPVVNGFKNEHVHTSGNSTLNDNMNVSGNGHMGHGYANGYENGNGYSQNQPTTAYPSQHSEINNTFNIIPNTQDPALNALDALHPNGMDQFNNDTNSTHNANNNMPLMETLETDWFQLLFGTTEDLASQPPPAFPPLHFQPPPLPPPTRFYVPPDFLPKHSLHDLDDSHGGEFTRVLIRDDKRAEMMADPAFLAPYFPNLDERIVIRHYLRNTVNITVAFQCPRKPWNPWITIHAPLAFNHLPGVNPAADALRAAILAVGAVHLRFTHDSSDQKGAWAIVRASKAKVLSLVRRSIDSQQATNTPMDKGDVEMILAALLSCTIASSLAADESWHELLTSVVSLVGKLGGAQALLREGRQAHIDTGTAPGMEVQQMSALRFLLEQLAVRDVFGCMTTELAPNMLNVAFSPWFFEAESWSKGDDEWESIERMFGISRGMVDVIARACMLISQVRKTGITISEDLTAEAGWGTHTKEFTLRLPSRVISRLDSAKDVKHGRDTNGKRTVGISPHAILVPTPPISSSPAFSITTGLTPAASGMGPPASASTFPSDSISSSSAAASASAPGVTRKRGISPTTALIQADILQAANGLIAELSVWDKSSNFTPFHPRTQYGNHTYRHAIRIRLLREVFMVPMDDKRVQDSVGAIVELTVELLAQYGRITWLTWPIVLAAFNMLPKDPQREVALALLNEFTYHACFDLTAARKMLCEFWEEEDMATTPGQVVKRQRVRPFLD